MEEVKKFNEIEESKTTKWINSNKYPLIITLGFFLIFSYIAFFHHNYWWSDIDGLYYFQKGEQIFDGDGHNINSADAPIGGPVLYYLVDSFVDDGFSTVKIVSLLSGTGIVFVSFYILKNIFTFKFHIFVIKI